MEKPSLKPESNGKPDFLMGLSGVWKMKKSCSPFELCRLAVVTIVFLSAFWLLIWPPAFWEWDAPAVVAGPLSMLFSTLQDKQQGDYLVFYVLLKFLKHTGLADGWSLLFLRLFSLMIMVICTMQSLKNLQSVPAHPLSYIQQIFPYTAWLLIYGSEGLDLRLLPVSAMISMAVYSGSLIRNVLIFPIVIAAVLPFLFPFFLRSLLPCMVLNLYLYKQRTGLFIPVWIEEMVAQKTLGIRLFLSFISRDSFKNLIFGILLMVMFFSGYTLRNHAPGTVHLTMDSFDTLQSARMLARGEYLPLENQGAFPGMSAAPVAEWIYAIPLFFSDNLDSTIQFTILANLLAFILLSVLTSRYLGRCAGLVVCLTMVYNVPNISWFSRQPINCNLAAPLAILYFYLLLRLGRAPSAWRLAGVALTLGVLLQIHPSAFSLFLLLPLQRLAVGAGLRIKEATLSLIVALLPTVPLLLVEWRSEFSTIKALIQHLITPPLNTGNMGVTYSPLAIYGELNTLFSMPELFLSLLLAGGILLLVYDLKNNEKRVYTVLFLAAVILPVLYLSAVSWWLSGRYYPHYLASCLPFAAVAAGRSALFFRKLPGFVEIRSVKMLLWIVSLMMAGILYNIAAYKGQELKPMLSSIPVMFSTRSGMERLAQTLNKVLPEYAVNQRLKLQLFTGEGYFTSPGGISFLLDVRTLPYGNDRLTLPWARPWPADDPSTPLVTVGILPPVEIQRLSEMKMYRRLSDAESIDSLVFLVSDPIPDLFIKPGDVLTPPLELIFPATTADKRSRD